MAIMTLYTKSFDSTPYVYQCHDFDFMTAAAHSSESDLTIYEEKHSPSLSDPFYGFSFECNAVFNVTEGGEVTQYNLCDNLPASFLPDLKWKQGSASSAWADGAIEQVELTPDPPSDFADNFLNYYVKRSTGLFRPNQNNNWSDLIVDVGSSNATLWRATYPTAIKFLVTGGLYNFSFGVRNCITQITPNVGDNYNGQGSGQVTDAITWLEPNGRSGSGNSFSFQKIDSPGYLLQNKTYCRGAFTSSSIPNAGSRRVQTFPVFLSIPAGSTVAGWTFSAKTDFYGILSVRFSAYGSPEYCSCSVLSKNMWGVKSAAGNSAGADSLPSGGHGKQKKGNYDPRKTITKNTSGGLLTNPTTAAGFVIYQFTPAEFTAFLSKVYTETALPMLGNYTLGTASEVSGLIGKLADAISKGWSNTENIVFVKTSPVNFPTVNYSLQRLSIGALGVQNVAAKVVQEYIVSGSQDLGSIGSAAEWFTDVEPYASASVFFPLAGSVAIPPSVLDSSSCSLRWTFNLLNNGCGYSMHIQKGGNYIHLAKNGECAKSADCVIPGRDISGTVGQLGALAATGIATLATGGTAAPALTTTALGAATSAVHEATDLSITNMPPTSSGSPYDDTVNGGLRDIVLYRTKAERYTSGEGENNQRSGIMGTHAYSFCGALDDIQDGAFFSVYDVRIQDSAGMTKAEHDRIIALLQEGVWK